jgi:hypothetical protein
LASPKAPSYSFWQCKQLCAFIFKALHILPRELV